MNLLNKSQTRVNHINHTLESTASSMVEYASTVVELECLEEAEEALVEEEE